MATRAKNRKKTFKQNLLGQWPDFKMISQKYSSYPPLSKLPKWFCSAEQNGCQSLKLKKKKQKIFKGQDKYQLTSEKNLNFFLLTAL